MGKAKSGSLWRRLSRIERPIFSTIKLAAQCAKSSDQKRKPRNLRSLGKARQGIITMLLHLNRSAYKSGCVTLLSGAILQIICSRTRTSVERMSQAPTVSGIKRTPYQCMSNANRTDLSCENQNRASATSNPRYRPSQVPRLA